MADCNAAVRLAPDLAAAYEARGGVREVRGEEAQALANYSDAIARGLDCPFCYFKCATLHWSGA